MFRVLSTFLIDALFPLRCWHCGAEGTGLCLACEKELPASLICWCPWCGTCVEHSHDYGEHGSALDGAYSWIPFQEQSAERAVHDLKFGGIHTTGSAIGIALGKRLEKLEDAIITNVPLHTKRERERGFDQAAVLAKAVSVQSGVPYTELLERTRMTQRQAKQHKAERAKNLQGAFAIKKRSEYVPATVYLVDDVITTGATLDEAAKALKAGGVRNVLALTFAYAVPYTRNR